VSGSVRQVQALEEPRTGAKWTEATHAGDAEEANE
jgi:hypothetical protein